jgi:hypothetical protein
LNKVSDEQVIQNLANEIAFWRKQYNGLVDKLSDHGLATFKVREVPVEEIIESFSTIS